MHKSSIKIPKNSTLPLEHKDIDIRWLYSYFYDCLFSLRKANLHLINGNAAILNT